MPALTTSSHGGIPHLSSSSSPGDPPAAHHPHGDDLTLSSAVFAPPPPPAQSRGPLHPGATWEGLQRSGRNSYKVRVRLDTVDLLQGTVTGLLQIQHLTPELDSLVTFFEGEIIGTHAGFRTARWGATEADDMKHWSRFPAFTKALRSGMKGAKGNFKHMNRPFLFMRWKEQFVVPSSRAQNIHGASFAGFYYLCLECDDYPSPSSSSPNSSAAAAPFSSPPARGLSLPPPPPPRSQSQSQSQSQRRPLVRLPSNPAAPTSMTSGFGLGLSADTQSSAHAQRGGPGPPQYPHPHQQQRSHSFTSGTPTAPAPTSSALEIPPPLTTTPPTRPRRAASFSYASIVRGNPSVISAGAFAPRSPPPPLASPSEEELGMECVGGSSSELGLGGSTPGAATPKDTAGAPSLSSSSSAALGLTGGSVGGGGGDGDDGPQEGEGEGEGRDSQQQLALVDYVSRMGLTTSSPSSSPEAIRIPIPHGTTESDFPEPSSPPPLLPPQTRASSSRSQSRAIASTSISAADSEQRTGRPTSITPTPSSSAPSAGSGRWPGLPSSTTVSTASETISGRPPRQRRPSLPSPAPSSSVSHMTTNSKNDFGLTSWSRFRIQGYYFHMHSEPYQELELRYVFEDVAEPREDDSEGGVGAGKGGRRGGTSEGFEFR